MPSLAGFDNFIKSQSAQPTGLGLTPMVAPPPSNLNINQLIDEISPQYGIDPEVTRALVKLESGGNPNARPIDPKTGKVLSSAKGLMQLIDATAREMGVQDPFDPVQNIHGGLRYLKQHLDATGGDLDRALRMYNQGPAGPLHEADDYVNKFKKFYGKEFTPTSASSSEVETVDIGSALKEVLGEGRKVAQANTPLPTSLMNIVPVVPDTTADLGGTALGRGVNKAYTLTPENTPQLGKLPFGVENKGGTVEQIVKDIAYGIPEGGASLASMAIGMVPATAAGLSSFGAAGTPETGAFSDTPPPSMQDTLVEGKERFDKVMGATTMAPQTATGKYIMRPFEVAIGSIYNTHDEVVRDLNPNATPEELEKKFKAGHFVLDVLGAGAMAKGVFRGKPGERPAPIKVEDVEAAKAEVLANPEVAPEVKVQVESVTSDLIQTLQQKVAQSEAKARVEKAGTIPAKTPENQSIVDGLLMEVELREGRARVTMRKAAKIVADHDGDIALADLKGIKGINPEGSTGKAVKRLIEERDAAKKVETPPSVGDDVPLGDTPPVVEPVAEISTIVKTGRDEKYGIDVELHKDKDGFIIKESDPNSRDLKISSGYGGIYLGDHILNMEGEFVPSKDIVQAGNAGPDRTPFKSSAETRQQVVELVTEIEFNRKIGNADKVAELEGQLVDIVNGKKVDEAPPEVPFSEPASIIENPTTLYRGEPIINERPTPSSSEGAFFYGDKDKNKAAGYATSIRQPELKGAVRELEVPSDTMAKLADITDDNIYNKLVPEEDRNGIWARGNNPTPEFNQALRDNGYQGFKVDRGDKVEFYLLPEAYKDLKFKELDPIPSVDLQAHSWDKFIEKKGKNPVTVDEAYAKLQEHPVSKELEKLREEHLEMSKVEFSKRDQAYRDKEADLSNQIDELIKQQTALPESKIWYELSQKKDADNIQEILNQQKKNDLDNKDSWDEAPVHGTDIDRLESILTEGVKPGSALDYTKDRAWASEYPITVTLPSAVKGKRIEHNGYNESGNRARVARVEIDLDQYTNPKKYSELIDKLQKEHTEVEFIIKGRKVEDLPISEFDSTSKAKEEGYTFPDKARYASLDRAKAKAAELGDDYEVVKVKGKYKVAKFEETPVTEFPDVAAVERAGLELMSEIPPDKVQFESPSTGEGFGIAKVGDKYYRTSTKVEMPRKGTIAPVEVPDMVGDGVSMADYQALLKYTDEATLRELEARDRVKELTSMVKGEGGKPVDPALLAEFQERYKQWKDSYVTKCNIAAPTKKGKAPKKSITKESLALVDDNFKTFKDMEDAKEWMESTGAVGELIPDPLTGKVSFMNTERLKGLDELDMWDEGVEQLTGRSERLLDEEAYPDMEMSDTGVRDLFSIFNNERGSIEIATVKSLISKIKSEDIKLPDNKNSGKTNATMVERIRLAKIADVINKDIKVSGRSLGSYLTELSDFTAKEKDALIKLIKEFPEEPKDIGSNIVKLEQDPIQIQRLRRDLEKEFGKSEDSGPYMSQQWIDDSIRTGYPAEEIALTHAYSDGWPKNDRMREIILRAERGSLDVARKLLDKVGIENAMRPGDLLYRTSRWDVLNLMAQTITEAKVNKDPYFANEVARLNRLAKNPILRLLDNERGSVDVTSLYSAVDAVNKVVAKAKKMGKSIDEYLDFIGVDQATIDMLKVAMAQVPQMKERLKEEDSITTSIFMPESKIVNRGKPRLDRNKNVVAVEVPITQKHADMIVNASGDAMFGKTITHKNPETGKEINLYSPNSLERAMNSLTRPLYALKAAGFKDLYNNFRDAASNAAKDIKKDVEWLKGLSKEIDKERRENFSISMYEKGKSVKEALDAMGIKKSEPLTPREMEIKAELFRYMEKFLDKINYVRTHTGLKPIPKLLDVDGNPNYIPLIRAMGNLADLGFGEGLTTVPLATITAISKDFKGVVSSYSKQRKVSDMAIELDPFMAIEKYIRTGHTEVHLSPVSALAKRMATAKVKFPDGKSKSLLQHNPALGNLLLNWSDQIIGRDPATAALMAKNGWIGKSLTGPNSISAKLVAAIIGGSLRTVMVQPSAYLTSVFSNFGNPYYAIHGVTKLIGEKLSDGMSRYQRESNMASLRETPTELLDMVDYIQRGLITGTRAKLTDISLKPMAAMDRLVAEMTWNAAVRYGEKALKMEGKDAVKFADEFVEKAQGLSHKGAVSPLESTAATKWMTTLQSFGIAEFNFIARNILGIKNPSVRNKATIARVVRYGMAMAITGQIYKWLGLDNVVPDPLGEYEKAKEEGASNPRALLAASSEVLEKVPLIGSAIKYGSSPMGPIPDAVKIMTYDAAKSVADLTDWNGLTPYEKKKTITNITKAVGYAYGIPGTHQIMKSVNAYYKGGNPWEVILGVYKEEKKKKGGLRPEIPRPPQPPRPF